MSSFTLNEQIVVNNSVSINDLLINNSVISNANGDITIDPTNNCIISGQTISNNGFTALTGSSNNSSDANIALLSNAYNTNTSCSKIVLRNDNGNFYGIELLGGISNGVDTSPQGLINNEMFAINCISNNVKTRVFNITNTGSIGINTSTISSKITCNVGGSNNQNNETLYHGLSLTSGSSNQTLFAGYDTTANIGYINCTNSISLQTTGNNVGIGIVSPQATLHIANSNGKRGLYMNGDSGSSDAQAYLNGSTNGVVIKTNNTSSSSYGLSVSNSNNTIFQVNNDGVVSIGTPYATSRGKLDINGFNNSNTQQMYTLNATTPTTVAINGLQYSLYCSNGIGCSSIAWTSDERVKTEISDVDNNWSLQKVRDIQCKEYHYKDPQIRRQIKTIGYIAQEVNQHLPQAINTIKEFIPDEMRDITNTITWKHLENNKYQVILPDDLRFNAEHTRNIKFYVQHEEQEIMVIKKADYSKRVIFDEKYEKVFMWGKEVTNFLQVSKDKIFALYHGAIQQIDSEQLNDKKRISDLEYKNKLLTTEIDKIKKEIIAMKSQLYDALTNKAN